jgi:superfamily I DNA/RNA helicase
VSPTIADATAGRRPGASDGGGSEDGVRVRTFHALGREILRDAGIDVSTLLERTELLRTLWPDAPASRRRRLDDLLSRMKLDRGLTLDAAEAALAGSAGAGSTVPRADASLEHPLRALVAYERALRDANALDFDDLVVRAVRILEADITLLARWRSRCAHLLVDEVQDVDRSQLRLALLLAAPANRIFLVGDDDQTIYGWRLADVRRVLALDALLPGLRRIDLETNYRCPRPVVERAVRLVSVNRERFAKRIRAREVAAGRLILAPDASDDHVRIGRILRTWPTDGATSAILARTNGELLPAVAAAVDLGRPFRAPALPSLLDDERLEPLLARAAAHGDVHPLIALARVRRDVEAERHAGTGADDDGETPLAHLAAALLAWAPPYETLDAFRSAIRDRRARIAALRQDDAPLTLATIHGTKGLEFDHVAVVGMERGRFPSERSVSEALEPPRALEEERRLAYVAWTRARVSLTLSFDPAVPSPFLLEAFDAGELPSA